MSSGSMLTFGPRTPLRSGISLIEASAGTGKTYNITNIVVRLVAEHGFDIGEILVVTFTRAATTELRDRVRRRLGEGAAALELAGRREAEPPEDPFLGALLEDARAAGADAPQRWLQRLQRARARFDEAVISTIHGFCQMTLSGNAFDSDVELDAEQIDDVAPLLERVVDDFIALELRDAELSWYRYVTEQAGISRGDLLALARLLERHPGARLHPQLPRPIDATAIWREAHEGLADAWEAGDRDRAASILVAAAKAKRFASTARYNTQQPKKRAEQLDAWVSRLREGAAVGDDAMFLARYFSTASIVGDLAAGEQIEPLALFEAAQRAAWTAGEAFKLRFADTLCEQLPRHKRDRNVLSFQDQLQLLAGALSDARRGPAVRRAIRARFRCGLIDEFQDTDPLQWQIFREAFKGAQLCLIGDPKQAIYAFRGADVYTYVAAKRAARAGRFTLTVNWRSDQRYLDAVNQLFDQQGAFGEEGIDYQPVAAAPQNQADRLEHRDGPRPPLEIRFFGRQLGCGAEADELAGNLEVINTGWADRHLPAHVASDIVSFLHSGATLRPSAAAPARRVGPADIAVLVRTNRRAQDVEAALEAVGVPAVVTGAGSVFRTHAAELLLRLLEALLHPTSEREAKAAFASELFGVTAVQLATMADEQWEQRVEALRRHSELWRRHGVMRALRGLFREHDVASRLLAGTSGERSLTNLLHLAELLHAAEMREQLGPSALTAWLRARRRDDASEREEAELRLESDADAVTIVTVHRSKGLEYPVVWCPDLWHGRLLRPQQRRHLSYHDEAGKLAIDLGLTATSEPKARRVPVAERELQTEQLRLLYVALTRARHRCVVYWGPLRYAETSALASLLHSGAPPQAQTDRLQAARARFGQLDDPALLAELRALATAGGAIAIREATAILPERYNPAPGGATTTRARPFDRLSLDRWWRRGSFSAMTRRSGLAATEGSPEAEGQDRDQDDAPSPATAAGTDVPASSDSPDVVLAAFPRGTEPGTFLHKVLELYDFEAIQQSTSLRQLLSRLMPRYGIADRWLEPLLQGLGQALITPLGPEVGEARLCDIARRDRLDELSFDLPVAGGRDAANDGGLTAKQLAALFAEHRAQDGPVPASYPEQLERLSLTPPLRGYLTGAIDMVFRRTLDGGVKWFIVDYKSNWLGDADRTRSSAAHYRPAALRHALVHHDYILQYHLYLVALHRWLRWRLGTAYDYNRDVGGALYLFLRGMSGADGGRDDRGRPCGVAHDKPPRALIEGLSELLRAPTTGGMS